MLQLSRIHGILSSLSLTKHTLQLVLIKYLKYNNNLLNINWQQIHCGNSKQKCTRTTADGKLHCSIVYGFQLLEQGPMIITEQ